MPSELTVADEAKRRGCNREEARLKLLVNFPTLTDAEVGNALNVVYPSQKRTPRGTRHPALRRGLRGPEASCLRRSLSSRTTCIIAAPRRVWGIRGENGLRNFS